jgi:hypothetical protein
MAPFHYMLKAPSVSNLDVIEHTTVYLTYFKWLHYKKLRDQKKKLDACFHIPAESVKQILSYR